MLNRFVKLLTNFPMKSIFITIVVVILLVFGVRNVLMATGNDTLVKTDTDVYQDNEMLEKEFGGESVIVLYASDDLLTPENLKHMKGIEDALQTNESIYSMMSPVTLVEEIAGKQSDQFQDGIKEMMEALEEMGIKLVEIGDELKVNANNEPDMTFPELGGLELPNLEGEMDKLALPEMEDTALPEMGGLELPGFDTMELPELDLPAFDALNAADIDKQIDELVQIFSSLTEAQEVLSKGTGNLVDGYDEFGEQLGYVGESLLIMTEQMHDNPQKDQLVESSQQLLALSEKMSQIADESGELPQIPDNTAHALKNLQVQLNKQLEEQKQMVVKQQKKQKQMQEEMLAQQEAQKITMQKTKEAQKVAMQEQMDIQQAEMEAEIRAQMEEQQNKKEAEMQKFKDEMEKEQAEQVDMLTELGDSLTTMGDHLQEISGNMGTIEGYSDIMTPGLPDKQATLDNMLYDDGELRSMFHEVVVDDHHMMMMIKFNGDTDDEAKNEVVDTIRTYLDNEQTDSLETIVSGKPVLDSSIRSSMQESIQKMMALALMLMVIVLFFVFKVRWFLLPLLTVLVAVIGTVGLMGWVQIPITMVSMAVFPILIGLGIDYAIQFQNRYAEEMAEEDSNE